jgi:CDP-paratose synthetase
LKTILLTGATGFLGSHLLDALLLAKYNVIITKRTTSNCWRIVNHLDSITSYNVDQIALEVIFINHQIDIVIHTATCYGRNSESDFEIFKTNVLFSVDLLECAMKFNTDSFFNTDSLQYQYLNSYTLTKKQFAEWGRRCSEFSQLKFINLKLEHVYGPKDDESKFISWFIKQLKNEVPVINLTEGTQKRDFIHVDDVVSVYLLLLEKRVELDGFVEFEVGTGQSIAIKDFLNRILNVYEEKYSKRVKSKLIFGSIPLRDGEPMEIKANLDPYMEIGISFLLKSSLSNSVLKSML